MTPTTPLFKALIFDWDGTLSDSLPRIVSCLQAAAAAVNLPVPSPAAAQDIVGLGLQEALELLFPGIETAQVRLLRESYGGHFRRADREPSPFFAGVLEVLTALKERGFLLAVATGKSRNGLDRALAATGLNGFFDATRCADETAAKPDPAMLLSLLEQFALAPHEALMIGDTTYDMAMAERVGMPRLAVAYGAHDSARLLSYQPLACVTSFADIAVMLRCDAEMLER